MDIFINRWVTCLMTRSKRKRNGFDKFFDTEHRCFEPSFFGNLTKSSISRSLVFLCVSFWQRVDYFPSGIFPLEQEHFNSTPMTAIDNASGALLKKM
jgi:hypothetical protein